MFFVRIVGVTEVVEHCDRLDDSVDGFLAEGGDPRGDDGAAANQILPQVVVEGANPLGLVWSWRFSMNERMSGTSGCRGAARAA